MSNSNRRGTAALIIAAITLIATVGGVATAAPTSHPRAHAAALRGKRGKRGPRGFTGPAGPAGIASVSTVEATAPYCGFSAGSCSIAQATATCPTGSVAVGGAASADTIETSISTFAGGSTYAAVSDNGSDFSGTLIVTAICASGPGLQSTIKFRSNVGAANTLAARLRAELK